MADAGASSIDEILEPVEQAAPEAPAVMPAQPNAASIDSIVQPLTPQPQQQNPPLPPERPPQTANPVYTASQSPVPGMLQPGNINLSARPVVHNPDGSISTVRSISITDDKGRAFLIPTVIGNKVVSNDEAIQHFKDTGENLGVFKDAASADAYAQQLHEQQAHEYLPKQPQPQSSSIDTIVEPVAPEEPQGRAAVRDVVSRAINRPLASDKIAVEPVDAAGQANKRVLNSTEFMGVNVPGAFLNGGFAALNQGLGTDASGITKFVKMAAKDVLGSLAKSVHGQVDELTTILQQANPIAVTKTKPVGTAVDTDAGLMIQPEGGGDLQPFNSQTDVLVDGKVYDRKAVGEGRAAALGHVIAAGMFGDVAPMGGERVVSLVEKADKAHAGSDVSSRTAAELQKIGNESVEAIKRLPIVAERVANEAAKGASTPEEAAVIKAQVKANFWHSQDEATQHVAQQISTQELLDAPEDIHQQVLKQGVQQKAIDAAKRILQLRGIDPTGLSPMRVSDIVIDLLRTEKVPPHELFLTLHDNDISLPEFATLFGVTRTEAGRTLNKLSQFQKYLRSQALKGDSTAAEILKNTTGVGSEVASEMLPSTAAMSWWQRVGNIYKLSLVSQPATAVRNFIDANNRIGFDVINRAIDTTLQRIFHPNMPEGIKPIDPLGELKRIYATPRATKKQIDRLMAAFPEVQNRLFTTIAADIARVSTEGNVGHKILAGAEKAAIIANRLNMAQEYIVRRAVLATSLDRRLRAIGSSFADVVDRGQVPDGFTTMLRDSIKDALDVTFARTPRDGSRLEKVMSGYSKFVNNIPGAFVFEPFPRFLFNTLQFINDFMPTGYLKLLSKAERAKIAAGDFSTIGKATAGSAAFGAALLMRTGHFPGLTPGEKWYEVKTRSGKTIDLRPFVTLNPYLYLADLAVRLHDGRLQPGSLTFQNFRRDFLGNAPQLERAETTIEQAVEAVSGIRTQADFDKLFHFAGEQASALLTPFRLVNDFASEFLDSYRVQRSQSGGGFFGPSEAIVNPTGLPPRESPTRAAPPTTPTVELPFGLGHVSAGIIKQLSGLTIHEPKNAVESELDRLGFNNEQLAAKTGDPRADQLVYRYMGPLMETAGGILVNTAGYKHLSTEMKSLVMGQLINAARQAAMQAAREAAPVTFAGIKLGKQPLVEQRAINQLLKERGQSLSLNQIFDKVKAASDTELKRQGL